MPAKQSFLEVYEAEHQITMRLLRAFPAAQADFRPHPSCRSARELAWVFVLERGLGRSVFFNELAGGVPAGRKPPEPPARWEELLDALERAHRDFGELVRSYDDDELRAQVKFFVAPKTLGDWSRLEFAWFLLHDQVHHRGQLSVYLRMTGAKVPSIYGPSGDEPWF